MVGEHDCNVRFMAGSRNVGVSRVRNEKYATSPLVTAESPNCCTVQPWTCELGYGADTMFHRMYFLFCQKSPNVDLSAWNLAQHRSTLPSCRVYAVCTARNCTCKYLIISWVCLLTVTLWVACKCVSHTVSSLALVMTALVLSGTSTGLLFVVFLVHVQCTLKMTLNEFTVVTASYETLLRFCWINWAVKTML